MKLDFGTEHMIVEVIDGVGWVTFNNPERRNAVKFEMWEAIPKIFDTLVAQDDVRCIVMKGAGDKSFVAGADISEFKEKKIYTGTGNALQRHERRCIRCNRKL